MTPTAKLRSPAKSVREISAFLPKVPATSASAVVVTVAAASISLLSALPATADQTLVYSVKQTVVKNPSSKDLSNKLTPTTPIKTQNTTASAPSAAPSAAPAAAPAATPSADDAPGSTTKLSEHKITFGESYFIVDKGDQKTIYDFDRKRILEVDKKRNEYTDIDLHAIVYFRVTEFQNRKMLGSILAGAGIGEKIFDNFESENLFGVKFPSSQESEAKSVQVKSENGNERYEHNNTVVAVYEPSNVPIDNASKKSYRRFLADACALHPEIQESLLAQKSFPKLLTFHVKDGNFTKTTTEYTFKSNSDSPPQSTQPPDDCKIIHDAKLTPIYAALDKLGPSPKLPDRETVIAASDTAFKKGQLLESLLTLLEFNLASGDPMTDAIKKVSGAVNTDPPCKVFCQNIGATSPDAASGAVAALEAIDRTGLSKGDVIDIMCANMYQQMHNTAKARELMTRALAANPLITGAYHDLGNMYLSTYEMPTGWDCFRIAAKICPTHPMTMDTARLDTKLETDFPKFF